MLAKFVTEFAKRGLTHSSNYPTLKEHNFILSMLLGWKFLSYKYSDRTVLLPNFKTVGTTQAELNILKVEKQDVCISPFSQIQSHFNLKILFP